MCSDLLGYSVLEEKLTMLSAGFSLTHKVRFGECFQQMTRKMNLHCDTLDAHNACQNE